MLVPFSFFDPIILFGFRYLAFLQGSSTLRKDGTNKLLNFGIYMCVYLHLFLLLYVFWG